MTGISYKEWALNTCQKQTFWQKRVGKYSSELVRKNWLEITRWQKLVRKNSSGKTLWKKLVRKNPSKILVGKKLVGKKLIGEKLVGKKIDNISP